MSLPHETRSIQVWVDADIGVADMVVYLNTISGVRTLASCQGTIGEGGPAPFRAQVMATWTPEAFERLSAEFDISYPEECDGTWGYIHPREGWKAVASRPVEAQPQCENCETAITGDWNFCPKCGLSFIPAPPADTPATRCYVCDGLPCRCDLPDSPVIPDSSPTRNTEALASFNAYCRDNPSQRFWQALRNWSKWNFILGSEDRSGSTIDTFHIEGLDGTRIVDAPAVADTREPLPTIAEMSGLLDGEQCAAIAAMRDSGDPDAETGTADDKLPRSFVDAAAQQLDTLEREWRVLWNNGVGGLASGVVQFSDDGGNTWVDADTPSDKEQK